MTVPQSIVYPIRVVMLCVLFVQLAPFVALAQYDAHFKIYRSGSTTPVSPEEMLQELKGVDVVFIGEEHDDSIAHFLEKFIFSALANTRQNQQIALSMEMFDRDAQTVLSEYLAGEIKESHFKKDARVWSNYDDYRPLVELAKQSKIPVVAANAPMRYVSIASKKTQAGLLELSPEAKRWIAPLPYDTARGAYYDKLRDIMGFTAHDTSATSTNSMLPRSLNGQSLWDATMAWSVADYRKQHSKTQVVHVNGRFHTDEHFGICQQYAHYRPKDKVLVVSIQSSVNFPESSGEENWLTCGDFVIVTDGNVPKSME